VSRAFRKIFECIQSLRRRSRSLGPRLGHRAVFESAKPLVQGDGSLAEIKVVVAVVKVVEEGSRRDLPIHERSFESAVSTSRGQRSVLFWAVGCEAFEGQSMSEEMWQVGVGTCYHEGSKYAAWTTGQGPRWVTG
jgi:hypothetical protein